MLRLPNRHSVELPQQYWLHPAPPLVTNPADVLQLSSSSIKQNLAAHAESNPEISAQGTKPELAGRLRTLLEVRKMDLLVRKLIWQEEIF